MLKILSISMLLISLTGCATTKSAVELTPEQRRATEESSARVAEYRVIIKSLDKGHENGKLDESEWIKKTNAFNDLIAQEYELQTAITNDDPSVSSKALHLLEDIIPALTAISMVAGEFGMGLLKQLAESNTTY
jgi:hypothetical protein